MTDQRPPVVVGDERGTLLSLWQFQRESMVRKAGGITDDQARIVCEGNLALMRNLLKEEPALRARLFRGLLALA